MVTMAPLAARSGFSAARANRKVAVRLTSMTRRQSASVRLRSGTRCMMPALATSPSSRPNFSVRAVMARSAVSSSVTSPSMSTTLREALENALQTGFGQIENADAPSRVEQVARDGAADAAGGTGDQRDSVPGRSHDRNASNQKERRAQIMNI